MPYPPQTQNLFRSMPVQMDTVLICTIWPVLQNCGTPEFLPLAILATPLAKTQALTKQDSVVYKAPSSSTFSSSMKTQRSGQENCHLQDPFRLPGPRLRADILGLTFAPRIADFLSPVLYMREPGFAACWTNSRVREGESPASIRTAGGRPSAFPIHLAPLPPSSVNSDHISLFLGSLSQSVTDQLIHVEAKMSKMGKPLLVRTFLLCPAMAKGQREGDRVKQQSSVDRGPSRPCTPAVTLLYQDAVKPHYTGSF